MLDVRADHCVTRVTYIFQLAARARTRVDVIHNKAQMRHMRHKRRFRQKVAP
jgi:hypothetical protein